MTIRRLQSLGPDFPQGPVLLPVDAMPATSPMSDGLTVLVRSGILVHVGEFQCSDGPISFDEARIKRVVENHNAMILRLAADYGGLEKMPIGAFPAILDHHEGDSNERVIGRLGSLLRAEIRDVPGVGKAIWCVVTEITFLGKETIEKVIDGRIFHLSVGIDEESDTLTETSTVVEPAALGARLLAKGKTLALPRKGRTIQLSKGADKMSKKLEASKARVARLAALTTTVTKLKGDAEAASSKLRLVAVKSSIVSHLHAAKRAGKMTPAEFKKLQADGGIEKIAKLNAESRAVCLAAYDGREKSVIEPGQRGSTDASTFSDLGKEMGDSKIKKLKAETRAAVAKLTGKKLKSGEKDDDKAADDKGGKDAVDADSPKKQLGEGADDATKKKDMAADEPDAQAELGLGDAKSEDYRAAMALMQEQIDSLQTLMAKVMDELKLMTAEEESEQAELAGEKAPGDETAELAGKEDPAAALEAGDKKEGVPAKELAADDPKKEDDKGEKKKPE